MRILTPMPRSSINLHGCIRQFGECEKGSVAFRVFLVFVVVLIVLIVLIGCFADDIIEWLEPKIMQPTEQPVEISDIEEEQAIGLAMPHDAETESASVKNNIPMQKRKKQEEEQ
jgi:hypothetical protein